MTPEERFLEGFRLFERECQIMREEIRAESPDADDACVEEMLHEKLELKRRLDEPRCDPVIYVFP